MSEPDDLLHRSHKADDMSRGLLRAGLSVGAIGLAGAALGAVCPACVVLTPALLGLGAVQQLRARAMKRRAVNLDGTLLASHSVQPEPTKDEPMSLTDTHHRALVQKGALLVDVRTPDEYASGHVDGALNLPVQELPARLSELGPTSRPVVVYCRSGARSARAAELIRQAGYQVKDFGPMSAW